jgi:hypothetical protein
MTLFLVKDFLNASLKNIFETNTNKIEEYLDLTEGYKRTYKEGDKTVFELLLKLNRDQGKKSIFKVRFLIFEQFVIGGLWKTPKMSPKELPKFIIEDIDVLSSFVEELYESVLVYNLKLNDNPFFNHKMYIFSLVKFYFPEISVKRFVEEGYLKESNELRSNGSDMFLVLWFKRESEHICLMVQSNIISRDKYFNMCFNFDNQLVCHKSFKGSSIKIKNDLRLTLKDFKNTFYTKYNFVHDAGPMSREKEQLLKVVCYNLEKIHQENI